MKFSFNVKKLEIDEYKDYQRFLLEFKESLFFYSTKYKDFLEDILDIESNYLTVIDNEGSIQAILPLMMKEGKYGVILNSLPFYGSNGGILAKNEEAYQFLLNYYYELVKTVASATYVTNPLIRNVEALKHDVVDKRIGQWTSLLYNKNAEDNIMNSFDSSARRNIRKAIKSDVVIEIDNTQMDFLYEIHYENITSIGGKAKDKKFFEKIDKYFQKEKDYNIYIAKLNDKKIGALLLFYFNGIVEYFTPAIVSEYRNLQALPLTIYQAMLDANKKKYYWWNWGGTWLSQDGVYKFKKKFGAIDKEYQYYIKINNNEIYHATKEELLNEYDNFYVIPFDQLKD